MSTAWGAGERGLCGVCGLETFTSHKVTARWACTELTANSVRLRVTVTGTVEPGFGSLTTNRCGLSKALTLLELVSYSGVHTGLRVTDKLAGMTLNPGTPSHPSCPSYGIVVPLVGH